MLQTVTHTEWQLARRAQRLNPSVIREILKITERPGIISLAGGLPAPESFPVQAMREACERVLADTPREALQYAASEGLARCAIGWPRICGHRACRCNRRRC
jgi:2-aminoadipate transaminase